MINHNSRGLVGDLVDAGVYEEDFELVWANKRDEDGHDSEPSIQTPPSPPSPPNTPKDPKPALQSTSTGDSTSTAATMTTETSTSIATASATPSATLILQTAASVSSSSTLSVSTPTSSSEPSSTSITSIYAPASSPASSSRPSPETTITSTTTSMLNATALTAHNPTISPLSNDQDTTKEHQHTSSALAVTVSVTVIVSLLVLAVMAFLVRRRILRQRKRGDVLKDLGEKSNPGMEAWAGVIPRAKGNGIRRNSVFPSIRANGIRNSVFSGIKGNGIRNSIFPQAPRPALIRNSSVSTAGTMRDMERYEKEGEGASTIRAPSTMSLDWGDGVSIHSLETTDSEQPQGLGVRPQRRMSLIQDSEENDIESGDGSQGILSYYANMKYHRNPFADPEPNLNMDTSFSSIQLPNFEFDTWGDDTNRLSKINPQSPGDLTRDNPRKNTLSSLRPTSFLSETDTLESQKAMARASFGGALGHLGSARWSNPFSAKEKRGTRGYEEMGELEREERGEGKWKDKLSWVKGQVDRVKN